MLGYFQNNKIHDEQYRYINSLKKKYNDLGQSFGWVLLVWKV